MDLPLDNNNEKDNKTYIGQGYYHLIEVYIRVCVFECNVRFSVVVFFNSNS